MVFMQGLVPRENISQDTQIGYVVALEKNGVLIKYIKLIKDINDKVGISVRTSGGITSEFPIIIGLHQR